MNLFLRFKNLKRFLTKLESLIFLNLPPCSILNEKNYLWINVFYGIFGLFVDNYKLI